MLTAFIVRLPDILQAIGLITLLIAVAYASVTIRNFFKKD